MGRKSAKRDQFRGWFPIVGVGASAGGLEAFSDLLKHLPSDTGMGYVLVQHLDPLHQSALTQLLARVTSLPVREVTNDLRVEPDHVYVIPPGRNLSIAGGVLKLRPGKHTRTPHRSVDFFFEALAEDQGERAIGVVLSGTATDGTLGLEAIKAEGGITFAQDDSARYDSMPRSAVAAGCVDFVSSPEGIAKELARIAKHPYVAGVAPERLARADGDRVATTARQGDETPLPSGGRGTPRTGAVQVRAAAKEGAASRARLPPPGGREDSFRKILLLLRNRCGVDFSLYKSSTIQRRITRRMVLGKQDSLARYVQFLRAHPKELDALYSDALISVTSFFRNPEAFNVLQRKILPKLLQQRGDEPLRVWVLGCSTGQEAYSIAMAFVEASESAPRRRKLQVFATDINDALLDKARHGLYAKSLTQDVTPERLRRFFVEEEGGYRVNKALREMVVFAKQNLISDPPFSRVDLISCRNLLIYLEPSLQQKLLPVFHYALKPNGFLYLGASESIGGFTELFEPVDKKYKIYAKKAAPTPAFRLPVKKERGEPPPPARPRADRTAPRMAPEQAEAAEGFRVEFSAQREADRITVNQLAPPGVLINAELQVLQFRGSTSRYLAPPTGKASFDVLKMAREGLMLPLRDAINKAKKGNRTARKENVQVRRDGKVGTVNVEVIPLKNLRERCFLVLFEDAKQAQRIASAARLAPRQGHRPARGAAPGGADSRRVTELEAELAETRDYLQSMQEQHEAANEELQAANEEVQSANEELQSINEELETSKEELESANEELTTVNEEMANRNVELGRLNSDLVNVQTSAHLALVLLARDLTIRRFSAQAEKFFGLLTTDVGRPIGSVRHNLDLPDLQALVAEVVDTVRAREREVQDKDGRWFSLRVRPYLTLENKVDGAVLVLTDIDALKRSEIALAVARDYAENTIATVRGALLVLDRHLRVETANRAFYRMFRVTPAETVGERIYDLGNHQWDQPRLRTLLEAILPQNETMEDFRVEHDFQQLGRRTMLLNARRMHDPSGRAERILLAIEDVTAHERAAAARARLAAIVDFSDDAILSKDLSGVITSWNIGAERLFGYTAEEAVGQSVTSVIPAERFDEEVVIFEHVRRGEILSLHETVRRRKDGTLFDASVTVSPIRNEQGEVVGASTITRDISGLKRREAALVEADHRKNEFLAMLAHELRGPLAPIRNALEIARRTAETESTPQRAAAPSHEGGTARSDPVRPMRSALEILQRQVGHMVRLVDDLLDVGRISRGKVALRRDRVELSSVVYHAVEGVLPLCESRGQELTVTQPPEPVYLDADPTRLAQIVGNLLSNASKFTHDGGRIWVTVERVGSVPLSANSEATAPHPQGENATAAERSRAHESEAAPVTPYVVLSVRDTGIGIAADQLPRVFDMFMQVDTSLERSVTGLGLGLTLVKTMVEMHGGTVEVRSAGLGQGSEFVVHLPILAETLAPPPGPARSEPHAATEPTATTTRRILVVDDNRDSAESLALLLGLQGHETYTAYDGRQAVERAATLQPDVILLDIGLPQLNGYEAARRIRAQERGKKSLLVALTGWGQAEDRRRSDEAGFDAHLVKPVDHVALAQLLRGLDAG